MRWGLMIDGRSGMLRQAVIAFSFVLVVTIVLAGAWGEAAQPNGLPTVPEGLPAQQTASLTQSRARVVAEGERMQKVVEDHHASCAHVGLPMPSGQTPPPGEDELKAKCDAEQTGIDAQVKRYAADASAYRRAVEASLAAATKDHEFIARVSLKGTVDLVRQGGTQQLTTSTMVVLGSGERIVTAPHARAAFTFAQKDQLVVGSSSELLLQTMRNDPSASKRSVMLKLTKGTARWTSGATAVGGAVSVTFPAGMAQIRDCDVQTSISSDGGGYVAVFKGEAGISEQHPARTVVLRSGQKLSFSSSGAYSEVQTVQPGAVRPL
jgi:FecR-like protein